MKQKHSFAFKLNVGLLLLDVLANGGSSTFLRFFEAAGELGVPVCGT